jgi:hypothetical protein
MLKTILQITVIIGLGVAINLVNGAAVAAQVHSGGYGAPHGHYDYSAAQLHSGALQNGHYGAAAQLHSGALQNGHYGAAAQLHSGALQNGHYGAAQAHYGSGTTAKNYTVWPEKTALNNKPNDPSLIKALKNKCTQNCTEFSCNQSLTHANECARNCRKNAAIRVAGCVMAAAQTFCNTFAANEAPKFEESAHNEQCLAISKTATKALEEIFINRNKAGSLASRIWALLSELNGSDSATNQNSGGNTSTDPSGGSDSNGNSSSSDKSGSNGGSDSIGGSGSNNGKYCMATCKCAQ